MFEQVRVAQRERALALEAGATGRCGGQEAFDSEITKGMRASASRNRKQLHWRWWELQQPPQGLT